MSSGQRRAETPALPRPGGAIARREGLAKRGQSRFRGLQIPRVMAAAAADDLAVDRDRIAATEDGKPVNAARSAYSQGRINPYQEGRYSASCALVVSSTRYLSQENDQPHARSQTREKYRA